MSDDLQTNHTRRHFKSRVLPVLENLGIIKQHAISPTKSGDAAERDELVRMKERRARMTDEERKAAGELLRAIRHPASSC